RSQRRDTMRYGVPLLGLVLAVPAAPAQELSPAERREGFVSLFNAKDFSGWQFGGGYGLPEKLPANWKVDAGVIKLSGGGSADLGAAKRGKKVSPETLERMRQATLASGRQPTPRHVGGRPWTKRELAQLGKVSDAVLAARIGRTRTAVTVRRLKLGIPAAVDR